MGGFALFNKKNARVLAYIKYFLYLCTKICEYMKELLILIGLIGAAVILLSVGVIFRKDHSFRSQHIHQNKRMKQDNIHCATSMNSEARRASQKKLKIEN